MNQTNRNDSSPIVAQDGVKCAECDGYGTLGLQLLPCFECKGSGSTAPVNDADAPNAERVIANLMGHIKELEAKLSAGSAANSDQDYKCTRCAWTGPIAMVSNDDGLPICQDCNAKLGAATVGGTAQAPLPLKLYNAIPAMTDPLGHHWRQPADIRQAPMDETHVLLTPRQVAGLAEYSSSYPSGTYDGKCWKREGEGDDGATFWYLCWYQPHPTPGKIGIGFRVILQVEGNSAPEEKQR